MTDNPSSPAPTAERKKLTPAAERALAEAEARRKAAEASATPQQKEFQGPKGPEPTRYGDWERKGHRLGFLRASEWALPDAPTQPLVGEYAPIRENKCISAPAPGLLAPLVFGGAAVGVRAWRGGGDDAAGAGLGAAVVAEFSRQPGGARCRDRSGSGPEIRTCVTPSMSIRTIDGDTFEARVHLEPGLDLNTRVRLRGIDAPELKASCRAGIADGRGRDGRVARIARRRRRQDLQYRAGQIWRPRRRRRCDQAHRKCFDGDARRGSCPQLQRRPSQRLVCECRTNAAAK